MQRIIFFRIILLVLLGVWFSPVEGSHNNDNYDGGCVTDYDENTDYFSTKPNIEFAEYFNVTYFNSYKLISVGDGWSSQKIVAYQCGTPIPNVTADVFIKIPVSRVAITSTPQIPFIELLGERESIVAIGTNNSLVSSPCLLEMLDADYTVDVSYVAYSSWTDSYYTSYNTTLIEQANVSMTFGATDAVGGVIFSEWAEKTHEGVTEWLFFTALFYNRESTARAVVSEILNRYECVKNNAAKYPGDDVPKVMYSTYYWSSNVWSTGACPNFYCDIIESAGAEVIATGTWLNYDQWLAAAQNATIIWHVGDFGVLYDYFSSNESFTSIPAVVNQMVFDGTGNGRKDWFESRYAEPDLLFEDALNMIHPCVNPDHERVWLRNAFTEGQGMVDDTCTSWDQPLAIKADACVNKRTCVIEEQCGVVDACASSEDSTDAESIDGSGLSAYTDLYLNMVFCATVLIFSHVLLN